jgi:hypothetical protein
MRQSQNNERTLQFGRTKFEDKNDYLFLKPRPAVLEPACSKV